MYRTKKKITLYNNDDNDVSMFGALRNGTLPTTTPPSPPSSPQPKPT